MYLYLQEGAVETSKKWGQFGGLQQDKHPNKQHCMWREVVHLVVWGQAVVIRWVQEKYNEREG